MKWRRDVAGYGGRSGSSGIGKSNMFSIHVEIYMRSSLNQSPSKGLGTLGRLGSPSDSAAALLFVTDQK